MTNKRSWRSIERSPLSDEVATALRADRWITIRDCTQKYAQNQSTKLDYEKLCTRWVPYMLTDDHKTQRVDCSREFLQEYTSSAEKFFVNSIVTDDETWCYHFTPEMKEKSHQWLHTISSWANKLKETQSAAKVIETVFLGRKVVVLIEILGPLLTRIDTASPGWPFKTAVGENYLKV